MVDNVSRVLSDHNQNRALCDQVAEFLQLFGSYLDFNAVPASIVHLDFDIHDNVMN